MCVRSKARRQPKKKRLRTKRKRQIKKYKTKTGAETNWVLCERKRERETTDMRTTCVSCMFYLCMWQINQRRCVLLHCYSICGCSCMWCDVWLCVYLSYAACRAIYWFLAAVINNRIYECPQKSYAYASLFRCFLFSLSISLPPSLYLFFSSSLIVYLFAEVLQSYPP